MGIVIDYTKGFFEPSPAGETVGNISGNATLDLSSGNVFSHTPTANTTFVFSNPPASGTAYGMTLKVTGADVAAGYDLANASYDSVSFSVSGQDTFPVSLSFNNDGTKMYVLGSAIYQYSLSTAFDISTASYDSVSFSIAEQGSSPIGMAFNNDGTKIYAVSFNSSTAYQYTLSTAFDLSTASYDSVSFSFSGQDIYPLDIEFNTAGTKIYMVGAINDSIYQYSLSTAFDLSTASYDSVSFSVAGQDDTPRDLAFNNDGTKMYLVGDNFNSIFQYTLSTAFDISTASYDSVSFSVAGQETGLYSACFNTLGTKLYIVGPTTDTVYQYSTAGAPAAATFTYPASVDWPSGTAPDAPADGETDVLSFYTADGGTTWYGFQVGDALA